MSHTKSILLGLALLFATSLAHTQVNSQNANSVLIDSGKIRFYETKQIRGEETYQINQLPNGDLIVQAKTDLPFVEQENKALVNATLRTAKDLTPQSFAIKGPTLLDLEEATSIIIQDKAASIQDRGQNKSIEVPRNFFTMSGYVPVSLELMLRPLNAPIESFEPGVTKVPAELTVQINKKGESADLAEGLRMVVDVLLKITGRGQYGPH